MADKYKVIAINLSKMFPYTAKIATGFSSIESAEEYIRTHIEKSVQKEDGCFYTPCFVYKAVLDEEISNMESGRYPNEWEADYE